VREALERALRLEGYEVELAADGQEALLAIARRGVDAIVLDVLMPVMDGLEACSAPAQDGELDAGADADSAARSRRPCRWPRRRRRRLPRQAVCARGAPRAPAALLRRTIGGEGELSFADLRLDPGTHEVCAATAGSSSRRTEFLLSSCSCATRARC
jgi:two-component system response regulator MprA